MDDDSLAPQELPKSRDFNTKAALFLAGVSGLSAVAGFGATLATAKRSDPKYFGEGLAGGPHRMDTPVTLALRAFAWGSFYSVTGCGLIFYGIWKLSGAHDFAEFKHKMGTILPKIPKSDKPQGRTEFNGLTDLLDYLQHQKGAKDK